jgi:hypothetical protein
MEKETGLVFTPEATVDDLQAALSSYINNLIINDFEKLVFILYRIDINEKFIIQLLKSAKGTNAGSIIAKAIIERQIQKIVLRKKVVVAVAENNFAPYKLN